MFDTPLFASPGVLALGALTGLIFGFLLQKGRVTRFDVIVGQFLLRDFTVLKVMLTAIVVGGTGVWAMHQLGWVSLHVKGAALLANGLGGAIFGVGMATLGYCPGTGVAAIGDGARDAWFGLLGMLFGAAVYAEAYPWLNERILKVGDLGKLTLADAAHVSPWWFVAALAGIAVTVFALLERWEHRRIA